MRATLLDPLRERRERRHSRRHRARRPQPLVQRTCDPAVEQVREAGGPVDRASYACTCGYLFVAAVSTTVSCPHCGSGQAW